ncbi:hypothetical protein KY325_04595 [Candidatus Woesearchaeota archaeon]|nr:hypothetical protein [Candidatus Woesearchaeota archaeon]MBW3018413.1 hypothetical protein [Candidatus Woesearchaeota archaeon]
MKRISEKELISQCYDKLHGAFGKQNWWPTQGVKNSLFEIIIGTILTQNTAWQNAEKAIINLCSNDLIDVVKIKEMTLQRLAKLIRSAGYYNQKAERLKIMAAHLSKFSSVNAFFNRPVGELRDELLSIKGIGPETADSILLYAGNKPCFVVDAYTKRIFSRMGLCKPDIDYHDLQKIFIASLKPDVQLFKEYHALIVECAKLFCRKIPVCKNCPLDGLCKKRI